MSIFTPFLMSMTSSLIGEDLSMRTINYFPNHFGARADTRQEDRRQGGDLKAHPGNGA